MVVLGAAGALVAEGELLAGSEADEVEVEVEDVEGEAAANVAVTLCAWLIVRLQAPLPLQDPLHPLNVEPLPAAAVRVTLVPVLKLALQVVVQLLIPAGLEVTEPVPVPPIPTLRRYVVIVTVPHAWLEAGESPALL